MAHSTPSGPPRPPDVEVSEQGGGTLVRIAGRIDVHSATDLRPHLHRIIDESSAALYLDLEHALIADATALGLLLECHRRGLRRGHPMHLVAADERSRRLLRRLALRRHSAAARQLA
ncbi:MAG: STAS domain-containing protein [Tetrasphaera sp.]